MVRDVRACVVGVSAHVHPTGGEAETVVAFGGLLSSVCGKRRMDVTRAHVANVAPHAKAGAGGGGEGIWAGMPQPRAFTGSLSLFEQSKMVRNNSKGWLSRGDQSHNEPMSEEARSNGIQYIFSSPLPSMSRTPHGQPEAELQKGGLLMEALMGQDGNNIAASLLRRAQGEQVSLAVPEQPRFNDGWAHDEYVVEILKSQFYRFT